MFAIHLLLRKNECNQINAFASPIRFASQYVNFFTNILCNTYHFK